MEEPKATPKPIRVRVQGDGIFAGDNVYIPWDTKGTVIGTKTTTTGWGPWKKIRREVIVEFDRGVQGGQIVDGLKVSLHPNSVSFYVKE